MAENRFFLEWDEPPYPLILLNYRNNLFHKFYFDIYNLGKKLALLDAKLIGKIDKTQLIKDFYHILRDGRVILTILGGSGPWYYQ